MKYTVITQPPIQIIGVELTTNYLNGSDAQDIPAFVHKHQSAKTLMKIPSRNNPVATLCLYTDYDNQGNYHFIFGAEAFTLNQIPDGMVSRSIPITKYAHFTLKGTVHEAVPAFWKELWAKTWPFQRAFTFDYELYDDRYDGSDNSIIDIYISIK